MAKIEQEKNIAKIIKDNIDIVEIIGEEVVLKQSGSQFKGLSPFSEEKTPSFFVNPDKQLFYCFSSNTGGDVIDFVIRTKAMNFKEAIVWLANKKNISLPNFAFRANRRNRKQEEERNALQKLNKFAAHFFQEQLQKMEGEIARDYVKKREIPEALQIDYAIGFAPDSFNALRNYLLRIKAPLTLALQLGLLKTKKGEKARIDGANVYDAFRNRLMFPIRNTMRDIIGFGGRTLGDEQVNKYLNSPESPLYKKNQVLYNLDRAKKYAREKEEILFVEGYMDCIALEKAGFSNVVATLGTSLSTTQAHTLCNTSPRVIGLYDGDKAGEAATIRNMEIFLQEEGYPISGIFLPENLDPDDFLRKKGSEGPEQLKKLIRKAPAVLDEWMKKEISRSPQSKQGKLEVLERIAEKLALLRNPLWIQARIPDIATHLYLQERIVLEAVSRAQKQVKGKQGKKSKPSPIVPEKKRGKSSENKHFHVQSDRMEAEFRLLDLLLQCEGKREEVRQLHKEYVGKVLELIKSKNIRSLVENIARPLGKGESDAKRMEALLSELDPDQHPKWRAVLARVLVEQKKGEIPGASLEETIKNVQRRALKEEKRDIAKEIREAEINENTDLANTLLSRLKELEKATISLREIDG